MKKILFVLFITLPFASCKKYLDVVPDNVATIDYAFSMRTTAEKYLYTCYSYMPKHGIQHYNPGFCSGDEFWHYNDARLPIKVAMGFQNIVNPYLNYWDGEQNGVPLFRAIRECNIFIDNIHKVQEMDDYEKTRWKAEAIFLKAYYHFWLLRMYGPIPLIKENLPISAGVNDVKVERATADECFDYIVQLLDEAYANLPLTIMNENGELGRITQVIAAAVKAQVLVYAASPLFNGNNDFVGFKTKQGKPFLNGTYDAQKWQKAATACKEAIDLCHAQGLKLYYYGMEPGSFIVSPQTSVQLNLRNAVCSKWNTEVIWGNTNSMATDIQVDAQPRLDAGANGAVSTLCELAPTLKMAEMFYSKNGVPITEDNTYDYDGRYNLRTAVNAERFWIKSGYQTVAMHFDRESRFYASLGFDGSIWFGNSRNNDEDTWVVQAKTGQFSGRNGVNKYSITGYWPKKLVNIMSVYSPTANYVPAGYPWPVIRLADLYLMYAEALNEANGPAPDVYEYLNTIRARAGLPTVQDAWTNFSTNPTKYTNKDGLREIIHRERAIELAFEGQRYWDLRRWKEAVAAITGPVEGWDIDQLDAVTYYRPKLLYNQVFKPRDYFWPIKEQSLIVNKNLVQNPGW